MLKSNRRIARSFANRASALRSEALACDGKPVASLPPQHSARRTSTRFLDIHQMGNKAAIEKERARLADEMNRGYFADMSELRKHGGKIAMANKIIIPAMAAVKFPVIEVDQSDGQSFKLPICCSGKKVDQNTPSVPKATLLCLSFRASSQAMIDSWGVPFRNTFHDKEDVHLYEVSFIDSWLLCRKPIKRLLLRIMRNPSEDDQGPLRRQIVYSFGDHYYFRKELKILNLLTGYVFLLDKFGRIRWQGFGTATPEELPSLLSCTSLLLEEK
ncbi:LOW QUALITY PROTEIN: uncharacterized protein LOC104434030 [Eucalyptus grandis]|uniref:LOW QUALITY PROTEIN: uncharacterized protein LOC104434030 n=1 Tax=Eucalyptus grandis TaxID=71139 RepID=UPI00192EFFD9|nr:LOW QUALITY PROTEIN: uncharacterized protein LOC104434030 [Eucalyptus grandis]